MTDDKPKPKSVEPIASLFDKDLAPMRMHALRLQDKLTQWETGKPEGFGLGFKDLDKLLRMIGGELTTIAARPGQGKTAFAMQAAQQVASGFDDGVVAVFSAEMTGWALAGRMAASMSNTTFHKLQMGNGTKTEYQAFRDATTALFSMRIYIDDSSAPTTRSMFEKLDFLRQSMPVRAMVFDFLELGGDRTTGNEAQRISDIVLSLKDIAKALGIPVIALSQLNRNVESRANKMPALADLRGSGQIEQSSDNVMFIMRPEYYIERGDSIDCKQGDEKGVAVINVAKNKNGPVGLIRLGFIGAQMKFTDLEITRTPLNGEPL